MADQPLIKLTKAGYHAADRWLVRDVSLSVNQGEIVTHQTTKHYPPDTTAAAIWLNNRKPDRWRNKPEPDGQDDAPQPVNVVFKVQDASDPDRNRGDA